MYLEHISIHVCRAFRKAVRNRVESYQIYYLPNNKCSPTYSLFPLTVAQLTVNLLLTWLSPKQTEKACEK